MAGRSGRGEEGAWLLSLALAFLLISAVALPVGMWVRLRATGGVDRPRMEQALYLAESGASQAIAEVDSGVGPAPFPTYVCRSGTSLFGGACNPGSPDYVGCYTYAGAPFSLPGLTFCPNPSPPSAAGGVYTIYAVGLTRSGYSRQVVVLYSTGALAPISWRVMP
jgi:hypothetical protein